MQKLTCHYCGLPVMGPRSDASELADPHPNELKATARYCCLGCRIADGIISGQEDGESEWTITRLGVAVFFTMNVMVFTLVLWTWNLHDLSVEGSGPHTAEIFRDVLRYACLLFATPVLVLLGGPLVESTWEALRLRRLTTDVLLLLGVVAAFAYSLAALWLDTADVYFEVCCMILVAVTLGKWLEGTAKQKATKAIRSLRELIPKTVRVMQPDGIESDRPTDQVAIGDRLRILPGERIPLDGIVACTRCDIDQQLITGESLPVTKSRGEVVYAGSLNLSRELRLTAHSTANEGTIARLMQAVEEATSSPCRSTRLADRLAAWFVPIIFAAALTAFCCHFGSGLEDALMAAVSVVLIACPCALGIATPMALWVAIHAAARRGVVFRNGDAVINLAKLKSLGLDKTGTITSGDLQLVSQQFARDGLQEQVHAVACLLASSSNHPISKAVARDLAPALDSYDAAFRCDEVETVPGRGVVASIQLDGRTVKAALGSRQFTRELGWENSLSEPDSSAAAEIANAIVCVGWDKQVLAEFRFQDHLRDDSQEAINALRSQDIELAILTGDTVAQAAAMAQATGVKAFGQLLPEEKVAALQRLPGPVGMVGDGLNDSISLAKADVGIALGCGADVTREAADICLLGSSLAGLPWAIELARATRRTIRRNLFWAVGYNVVGIGFAITGNLNPIIAAIAMVGSSLFVLCNSLGLGLSREAIVVDTHHDQEQSDKNQQDPDNAMKSGSRHTQEVELVH